MLHDLAMRHPLPGFRLWCALALVLAAGGAEAQLTPEAIRAAAHRTSPELRSAHEAVRVALGWERQAGAHQNPTLSYGREQTSRAGQTNAQGIAQLEQPLEVAGQRAARQDVARLRRAVAEGRWDLARRRLDLDVIRGIAVAVAAEGRARLAAQTTTAFVEAQRVSEARRAAGDVAGYVTRRLMLEAARFAAVRATAELERHATRTVLAVLMGLRAGSADSLQLPSAAPDIVTSTVGIGRDSLLALAGSSPERRVAALEAQVADAEVRLAQRERLPTPAFALGYKGERVADPARGSLSGFQGFVAGVSVPLPLFDRRAGAIEAQVALSRRAVAEGDVVLRRISREVIEADEALRVAEAQRRALAPHLGEDARTALRAVQAAYAEGEITLVEWLDAMRAYHDAEATLLTLEAEVVVRRATLAHAAGLPLFSTEPGTP